MFVVSSSLSTRDFVAIADKNLFDREGVFGTEPRIVFIAAYCEYGPLNTHQYQS